ncbi:MAG: hypothetical protein EPO13_05845 [Actinomycetota bacterium]|nr:MAG: hypothetical protein EPO13_05845 [Actinomycetota bacterium]
MIDAVVFLPTAPIVVPEIAGAAAPELDHLRAAADETLAGVLGPAAPDRVILLAVAPQPWDVTDTTNPAAGDFADLGLNIDLTVEVNHGAAAMNADWLVPLGLRLGAWQLQRVGWSGAVRAVAVAATATDAELDATGSALATDPGERVVLVVMGDGSARRGVAAPGYLDPRAEAYDKEWLESIRDGDPAALADLDRDVAAELLVGGAPAWRAAAAATAQADWDAHVAVEEARYGVAMVVGSWRRVPDTVSPRPAAAPGREDRERPLRRG